MLKVRQGCILSPMLLNLYSEDMINRARVNGILINNIRYADDSVVISVK